MPYGFNKVHTQSALQRNLFNRGLRGMQQGPESLYQSPTYQAGASYLQNLLEGGPEAFARFEAPYLRQFEEQTIPMLAERFGGAGAQSSSAFQQALGGAGAGLSEQLASLRSGLQMQALPQALQYAQQPFQNLTDLLNMQTKALVPSGTSQWMDVLGQLLGGIGGGAAQSFGGGAGKFFSNKLFGM